MTKGILVDVILLAVNGGKFSQDGAVWRDDIIAYLPAAVASAVKADAYEKREEARRDVAAMGFIDFILPVEFLKEIIVAPIKDEVNGKYYVPLPALLDLPSGWNVSTARPAGSFDIDYIRVPGFQSLIGLQDIGQVFFWVVNRDSKFRAYFTSLPLPLQDVAILAAISPSDLEDGDEVAMPAGMEDRVIQMSVQHFRGQRGMPADTVYDDRDVNETSQVQTRRR